MSGFNNATLSHLGAGAIWSKCPMNESSTFVENFVDMICASHLKVTHIKYTHNLTLTVEYRISTGRVFQ